MMAGVTEGPRAVRRLLDRAGRRPETPVVLCIDVEPDDRVFDRADPVPWLGFERLIEQLPALRERLSEATGKAVAFNWFLRMDPQIAEAWGSPTWVADRYGEILARLTESGDQLGVHTHLWRWDSEADDWVVDGVDPAWGEQCVAMGLDAFEAAFGQPCIAHRGGDQTLTPAMISVLARHQVEVDLTVEPGLAPREALEGETVRGSSPDYRGVPTRPYRSSADRFPAPDPASRSDPLLMPLLSAPRMRPPFRRYPLYPWEPSKRFEQRLAVELLRKPPPVIAVAVRSDSALSPESWEMITERFEALSSHGDVVFTTASDAAARFDGQGF
jgi:hypothetical protein